MNCDTVVATPLGEVIVTVIVPLVVPLAKE
jgi:hypothetical protein